MVHFGRTGLNEHSESSCNHLPEGPLVALKPPVSMRLIVASALVVVFAILTAGSTAALAAKAPAKTRTVTSTTTTVATTTTTTTSAVVTTAPTRAQHFGVTAGCCTPTGVTLDDQVQGF